MITYRLILPDGEIFSLDQLGIHVDIGIPDGVGLPPITHAMRKPYMFEGALLNSAVIEPRIVSLSVRTAGDDRMDLHRLRSKLWNAVRWNRTASNPPNPMRLQYQSDWGAAYLTVYFLTEITAKLDRNDTTQVIGVRLIAYDPIWHSLIEKETCPLEIGVDLSVQWIIGKRANVWSTLGMPTAAATNWTVHDILEEEDDVYICGDFATWDNPADVNQRYISRYDKAAGTWNPLGTGGGGAGLVCYKLLALNNSSSILAVGSFTDMGGVLITAYIAKWVPGAAMWSSFGGGAGAGVVVDVRDAKYMQDGRIVIVGNFTNWDGIAAADYLVTYDEATDTWAALGAGGTAQPYCVEVGPDGSVYIGGSFVNWAGVAANDYIARWNIPTSTWVNVGGTTIDGAVWCLYYDSDTGYLYAGGAFTENIKYYNGSAWVSMGGGANGIVYTITKDEDGNIVAGGAFTTIGGVTVNRLAKWNGSAWSYSDIALPTNVTSVRALDFFDDEIWIGNNATNPGTATASESNTLRNAGNANAYPIFDLRGPMTMRVIRNASTGEEILFNCYLNPGEHGTLDLTPGFKTFESAWRGNLLQYALVLPMSDLGTFRLGSHPEVAQGDNLVSILATGAAPYEVGDLAGRLSGWENVTGVNCDNTDDGKLYADITGGGPGPWRVILYRRSTLGAAYDVAQTAAYAAPGPQALTELHDSGIGGSITIDIVGEESGIIIFFPMVSVAWRDAFLDVDTAVL